jgi:hypothetical protein
MYRKEDRKKNIVFIFHDGYVLCASKGKGDGKEKEQKFVQIFLS